MNLVMGKVKSSTSHSFMETFSLFCLIIHHFQKLKSHFYKVYNTIYTKKRQVNATSIPGNSVQPSVFGSNQFHTWASCIIYSFYYITIIKQHQTDIIAIIRYWNHNKRKETFFLFIASVW